MLTNSCYLEQVHVCLYKRIFNLSLIYISDVILLQSHHGKTIDVAFIARKDNNQPKCLLKFCYGCCCYFHTQIRNAMNKQMLELDQEVKTLRESQQELKDYKVCRTF